MKRAVSSQSPVILAGAFGFFTVTSQIILMREFFVVVGGNELLLGIFFFTWFLGIVAGAQTAARVAERLANPMHGAAIFLFIQALIAPSAMILIRTLRYIFNIPPGEYIPLVTFFLGTLLTLFPFSYLTGLNFPLLCEGLARLKREDAPSIGKIYTAESLGSIIGGLVFTFILVHILKPLPMAMLTSSILLIPLFRAATDKTHIKIPIGAMAIILLFCAIAPTGRIFEKNTSEMRMNSLAPGYNLVDTAETPYQHLSLVMREGQFNLLSNGSFVSTFPDPYATAVEVNFIMTVCPRTEKILILGGGNPQILSELLKYPVSRIDYVEVDRKMLNFLLPYLPEDIKKSLHDRRIRIHNEDARSYIRDSQSATPDYDIIWANLPEPTTIELNRFYTVDFHEECAGLLARKGVYVTSCSSAVNYFGESVSPYVQSLYKTLCAVYEKVAATPGMRMYLFATTDRGVLTLDAPTLARRFEKRKLASPYFTANFFQSLLEPDQVKFTASALEKNLDAIPLNTDLHPVSYLFNLRMWAGKSGSGGAWFFRMIRTLRTWHVVAALLLILGACLAYITLRGRNSAPAARFATLYLIMTTGACGIASEIIFLYLFQNIHGSLYQKIGLFIASFMAGLTAGAHIATRLLKRGNADGGGVRRILLFTEGAYWVFFLGTGILIARWIPTEILFYLIVFGAGVLTGWEFPLAGKAYLLGGGTTGEAAGRVNMADNAGAAIGAFLTGIVLVPALGIPITLYLLAFFKLTSLTILKTSKNDKQKRVVP
ncbi:MAG: fused MFS/spermidine synthase [Candidatus Sumerlaeota bacterium]|nr:fused MFS/spermidine synthase [Candidatus Sumerlaeota bacterium]